MWRYHGKKTPFEGVSTDRLTWSPSNIKYSLNHDQRYYIMVTIEYKGYLEYKQASQMSPKLNSQHIHYDFLSIYHVMEGIINSLTDIKVQYILMTLAIL